MSVELVCNSETDRNSRDLRLRERATNTLRCRTEVPPVLSYSKRPFRWTVASVDFPLSRRAQCGLDLCSVRDVRLTGAQPCPAFLNFMQEFLSWPSASSIK